MTESEEALRLFVACELPESVKDGLARIQEELRAQGAGRLRWARPEGVHLTMKFLGSVAPAMAERIREGLSERIREPFALKLRLDRVGSFGGQRVRVVWVGLAGDVEALAALAEQVEEAIEPLGFPREKRGFAPHLTLARVPDEAGMAERSRLTALVDGFRIAESPSMTLTAVSLMRSYLLPGGARYERLASFPPTRS